MAEEIKELKDQHVKLSTLFPMITWTLALIGFLIMSTIGLFLWMSQRELDKSDLHDRELKTESEKYIELHLDVTNEKLHSLQKTVERNEKEFEDFRKEVKEKLENK